VNPWLITWEAAGEKANGIPNRIAAILHNRLPIREVVKVTRLLLANRDAYSPGASSIYVFEQVRFAQGKSPYTPIPSMFPEVSCGGNPSLYARHAFNLKVSEDEGGEQVMTWEEDIFPYPPRGLQGASLVDWIRQHRPFNRRKKRFEARTNRISTVGEPT
jgi:hypothetical protein